MELDDQQARNTKIINMLEPIDKRIYTLIKQAPSTKKDLTRKTNLPALQLDKILHQLQSYSLIKPIKRPQTKNQNVWVLYHQKEQDHAQQAKQQTQQTTDFILLKLKQTSHTLSQLTKQLNRKGLSIDNLSQVLEIMQIRGDIQIQDQNIKKRNIKTINIPCIQCSLSKLCKPGATISPQRCPYFAQW